MTARRVCATINHTVERIFNVSTGASVLVDWHQIRDLGDKHGPLELPFRLAFSPAEDWKFSLTAIGIILAPAVFIIGLLLVL